MHRKHKPVILFLFLVFCWAQAHAHHLAVVVHQKNPAESVTSSELAKIFRSEMKQWPNGHDVVVVVNRNSPVAMQILERLSGMAAPREKAFLASHKDNFVLADSDPEVLDLVASKPGALGMVDVRAIDNRIKVLKVDGKLPLEKAYLPH